MSPSSDRIDPRLLVHQAFGERASREPWRVAATCGGLAITYGELRERSGALARHLRALGVGPDVLVALCLPRSLDLLVGILGVLEAGAEVYMMETIAGWTNLLPVSLGVTPPDEGGFWIPAAEAPK